MVEGRLSTEEGLTAWIFSHAKQRDYLAGQDRLSGHEPQSMESPLFMRFQVKSLARAPRFSPRDYLG